MNIVRQQPLALADGVRIEFCDMSGSRVNFGCRAVALNGPVFRDLLPLLNGTLTPPEVVTKLSSEHDSLVIWLAIELLKKSRLLYSTDSFPLKALGSIKLERVDVPAPFYFYRAQLMHPDPEVPPIHVGGFGETQSEAMVKCRGEATERGFGFMREDVESVRALKEDLDAPAYDPAELLNISDTQYQTRQELNSNSCDFDFIPRPFDKGVEIDWSPAQNLGTGERCWMPTALLYYLPKPIAGSEFGVADSNGCAAGSSFEQACVSGLLELIERDACAIWWYNQIVVPTINACAFSNDTLNTLTDFASKGARTLRLLDLTHDFGIPIVAAVSWIKGSFSGPKLGLGIAFNQKDAVVKALGELVTQTVTSTIQKHEDSSGLGLTPPDHILGRESANLPDRTTHTLQAMSDEQRLSCLLDMLHDRNLTCRVVDQISGDQNGHVVRVVVQGLRSHAPRFGTGRLFDESGSSAKNEDQMLKYGTISQTFMADV